MRRGALAKFLGWALAGVAGVAVAVFLVAWSGIFNVAASRGHWAVVDWFLAFGMRNSVELRAMAITPPPLDSPDLIRLGAGHFHGGCAFCHGAPGIPVSPIARHMLPSPPDLTTSMRPWKDEELFWIVQHGIKYTGMPGWVALEREDEIWAVVAFLKRIPTLDAESYRALALGGVRIAGQTGEKLATVESNPQGAGACARCHGAEGSGPASALVPVLHGQPAEFLVTALQQYAEGARRSGIMQPLAADLGAQDIAAARGVLRETRAAQDAAPRHRQRSDRTRAPAGDRGRSRQRHPGMQCLSRPRCACELPAPGGPECRLHGGAIAPVEGRTSHLDRRRRDHGADCAAIERWRHRCGDRLSFRSRRRARRGHRGHDGRAAPGGLRPAAAALLGGCGDNQSVLNPKGPEALQLAHLSWLLFAFGTVVLLLVVLATAVAIRGPQPLRARARFRPHGGLGRHRLPCGHPDRPSGLRRVADACEHRRSR